MMPGRVAGVEVQETERYLQENEELHWQRDVWVGFQVFG